MTEVGRNDPCPCGSGLKFKKCCGNKPVKRGLKDMKASVIKTTQGAISSRVFGAMKSIIEKTEGTSDKSVEG